MDRVVTPGGPIYVSEYEHGIYEFYAGVDIF